MRCRSGAVLQLLVLGGALVLIDQGMLLYRREEISALKRDTARIMAELNEVENARDATDLETARMLRRLKDLKARIQEDEVELAVSYCLPARGVTPALFLCLACVSLD